MQYSFLLSLLLLSLGTGSACAIEIMVNTAGGEAYVFDVDPYEGIMSIQDKVALLSNEENPNLLIEMQGDHPSSLLNLQAARGHGGDLGFPRNYLAEIEPDERANIRLIILTLANKSLFALAMDTDLRGRLETAGNDIDHIHPLRFLMTIFTDEELKVGIRNVRGRGWIWGQFIGGLKESLSTEMAIDNMKSEYVQHFAQTVKIDPNLIYPLILKQEWDDFVDRLITHIPRIGDHDRYDS